MIRSNRISVVDRLKFLAPLSAEEQIQWHENIVSEQLERLQLINVNNDILKQNGQLREMINQMKASGQVQDMKLTINLLKSAKEEIEGLKEMQKTSNARLGMFDDIIFLTRNSRRDASVIFKPQQPVESRIENFLNSIHEK